MTTVIDVSRWQGNIDWAKVAADDIFGAIIKAGGSDDGFYTDACYEQNYAGAKAAGVNVGAYYFVGPNCTSAAAGEADAKRFIEQLAGKQFEMPVYIDFEAPNGADKAGNTDAVVAFCKTMEAAGYFAGIYASDISGFKDKLELSRLTDYSLWVARYGSEPVYATGWAMWQYTSSGNVAGINGRVDMNRCLVDFPQIIKDGKLNGFGGGVSPTPTPAPSPAPAPTPSTNHSVGENVTFNAIYTSSDSTQPLAPAYTSGTITKVLAGTRNPYLINDGMGWTNDEHITSGSSGGQTYVVKAGDTLSEIAQAFGTTVDALVAKNGIENPNLIYVGQVIQI